MWFQIFKFELKYRVGRLETYVFFGFLLLFSIVGVDFIFQGVEIGLMKKNAPLVIAKTMGAITGIFMIMASMIMGVPVLRDYQYGTEPLLFVNPITKQAYIWGRFLGSFTILIFIFSGLPLGMMLGEQMPWHKEEQLLAFSVFTYLQTFFVVVLPSLFFGACAFFVTGMLSKKLLVVYTQGIVLFVLFLLTKAITNEYVQGILDPFSLTTLTQFTKDWTLLDRNSLGITLSGILLHNKLFWVVLGVVMLVFGYHKFSFSTLAKKSKRKRNDQTAVAVEPQPSDVSIPKVAKGNGFKSKCLQLVELSRFYGLSLLKETSFWAIVICGMVIITINSVNLGTVYRVDSYPATYFIIAELQEMSLYFFMIILLFYSGELIWKERDIKQYVLSDATPISSFVTIASKYVALVGIYVVLMLSLIVAGVFFQIAKGYYQFDFEIYFAGFFLEILPFLMLYTFVAFFFQSVSKNKFMGIICTLGFFIINTGSEFFGFNHSLYKFGGKPLGTYSEMNGYGHFLEPYLWIKGYWLVFGVLLLLLTASLLRRGMDSSLKKRLKQVGYQMTPQKVYLGLSLLLVFIAMGGYIFYNTNVLNTYWTASQEQSFRAAYEKTLKPLEYFSQPKITDVKLNIELYPETRSYEVHGSYVLENTTDAPIHEIHVQKRIASHVVLKDVVFEGGVKRDDRYKEFDYLIYHLSQPLAPQATLTMEFQQSFLPKGFEEGGSDTDLVHNGTFFDNTLFPTLGYNKKYELSTADERRDFGLPPRPSKAKIEDPRELVNARSGSDSHGVTLEVTIGTTQNQTAITAGELRAKWSKNNRNYFQYVSDQPIINFYPVVSAIYEVEKDTWTASKKIGAKAVDLEIYHHREHAYNLDRMMHGMKASLDYYSRYFGPYPYPQLRIMEFPRYADFAQSLPNTIPFSEALGFVLNVDDETDVDMAFYITAHEVAHQWFGMQVEAANVQGQNFVLESLAQYGALMVLKENYPDDKVEQFLELQEELYRDNRKKATSEPSLALVENEDFVYYNKGAIAMYTLQELIGEEKVNQALKRFVEDWRSHDGKLKTVTDRYTTSKDLLDYLKEDSPKDIHKVIYQIFETTNDMKWDEN